jgi:monovalent cation:H+ antiporter, CPA1 family
VLVVRAGMVFGLSSFGKDISWRWRTVMFWGGLRGAISLALAMSLPANLADRSELQAMAFGAVLFTLVIEGLSMKQVVHALGLTQMDPKRQVYERDHARAIALQTAQSHLHRLMRKGLLSQYTWRTLKPVLDQRSGDMAQAVQAVLEENPKLHTEELLDAWREVLRSQRSTLNSLFRANIINEEIYDELVVEVDLALEDPEKSWEEFTAPKKLETAED